MSDLAELEWRVSAAFHAYDKKPFEAAALSQMELKEWDNIQITFQPSVSILRSAWPVFDIWKVRNESIEKIKIEMRNRPQDVLVFRRGLEAQCLAIDPAQCHLLESLLAGKKLGEACEILLRNFKDQDPDVSPWFSGWVGLGLITACEIPARQIRGA